MLFNSPFHFPEENISYLIPIYMKCHLVLKSWFAELPNWDNYDIVLAPASRKRIEKVRTLINDMFVFLITQCHTDASSHFLQWNWLKKQNCSQLTDFNLNGLILATTNIQPDIEKLVLIFSHKSRIRILRIYSKIEKSSSFFVFCVVSAKLKNYLVAPHAFQQNESCHK